MIPDSEAFDDEIRDHVKAQLDERAQRRQRLRRVRAEFDRRRAHGLEARKRAKLERIEGGTP